MEIALSPKNKFGFIDGSIKKPLQGDVKSHLWKMSNDMVLSWILNSVDPDLANRIYMLVMPLKFGSISKNGLHKVMLREFKIKRDIASHSEGTMSVAAYYVH